MNKQKGFTIIELIVVIAIIAVLAAIVLVNVTQYINKGKDASIKGNMSSMVTIAASFYDDPGKGNNTYTGLGSDSTYAAGKAAIESANGANNVADNISAGAFCIQTTLNDATTWCVDSTGYKGTLGTGKCATTSFSCQ